MPTRQSFLQLSWSSEKSRYIALSSSHGATPLTAAQMDQIPDMAPLQHSSYGASSRDDEVLSRAITFLLLLFLSLLLSCQAITAPSRHELDALLAFKAAITADPLATLHNWKADNSTAACNWTGISCDPLSHSIRSITLAQARLQGTIAPQLAALSHLTHLNLSYNNFTGSIPSQLGNLTTLILLDLSNNYLNTTIPSSLGNLLSVQWLWLHKNLLQGSIPTTLENCTSLQSLSLAYNYLDGVLPPGIGQCSELTLLALQQNSIKGSIPPGLGKLPHLEVLLLYDNHLTGIIPSSLANCSKLNDLELSTNSLHGVIPIELGKLDKLLWLILFENNLTGTIPPSLANCTALTDLELGVNSFHGSIPPAFFQFERLVYLLLNDNNLSGSIPPIGNLSVMLVLTLANNQLQGGLPAEIGRLRGLQELSLAGNRLTGSIPDSVANCTQLSGLLLAHNSFSGSIPTNFGGLRFLNRLDLSYNLINGHIPPNIGNCTSLQSISMGHNELLGSLPTSLAALSSLQFTLDVSHNHLSGSLPSQLGSLILVQAIDMSSNMFSGTIPASIGTCTGLQELNLAKNNLSGSLPSSIADIHFLTYLNLSHNLLSQNLPTQLGALKNLSQLDLSYNQLAGLLTTESLQNLSSLIYFNVSYNNFTGAIPEGGVFKKFTTYSFLGNVGLCGSILHRACPQQPISSHSKVHLTRKTILVIAVVASAVFAILLFVILTKLKPLGKHQPSIVIPYTLKYKYLTEEDITVATNGFSGNNVIGKGGASTVYKATLNDGSLLAVKRFISKETTNRTFLAELHSLGTTRHRNLVQIHGYISSSKTKILLLDFMPNGSLDAYLHNPSTERSKMNWEARLQIIMGITHGLVYLHHHSSPPIVHCDLKPSNILLDTKMEAKITDFGLAKLIHSKAAISDMSVSISNLQGTIGYMAPESAYRSKASPKSDIYSYGIIILELITGKRPTDAMFDETCSLVSWVWSCLRHDKFAVLDADLAVSPDLRHEDVFNVVGVALMCTKDRPDNRPSMNEVLHLLEKPTSFRPVSH